MAKKKLPVEKLGSKPIPVKIVNDAPSPLTNEARERKYKAEDALRTIKEYEKVKSDKSLMKDVKNLARDEMKKLKNIC
jgi:ribose 5-phosphate isomerase